MTAIAFDTHKCVKRLIASGMPEAQAEAIADEQRLLTEDQLATKRDLKELEQRLIIRLGIMLAASIAIFATLVKII